MLTLNTLVVHEVMLLSSATTLKVESLVDSELYDLKDEDKHGKNEIVNGHDHDLVTPRDEYYCVDVYNKHWEYLQDYINYCPYE